MVGGLWQRGWLLGTAIACSAPAPPPAKPAPAASPAQSSITESPAPPPTSIAAAPPPTLREALCGDTLGCNVRETLASIAASDGTHSIVRITFPEPVSAEDLAGDERCLFEQFSLVARASDGTVTRNKPFASGCSEEGPAGWCGLPPRADVRIEGTTAIARWSSPGMRCMGSDRAHGTEVVSLETLHSLRSESHSSSNRSGPSTSQAWDWQTQRGTFGWGAGGEGCPVLVRRPAPSTPEIALDEAFVADGWQKLSLASCSTLVDQTNGVALTGKKADVELRLVASDTGVLFVDITLPSQTVPSPSAELKVCVASSLPLLSEWCQAKETPSCASIGLDGTLRSGSLGAEPGRTIARAPDKLRFKIPLPLDHSALTVAYSDPKSGHSLSTTSLKPFDTSVLGHVFYLDAKLARCQVQGEGLVLVRNPDAL